MTTILSDFKFISFEKSKKPITPHIVRRGPFARLPANWCHVARFPDWVAGVPRLARAKGGRTFFTLVELLVVIAIIGITAGLLLPVLTKSRSKAKQTSCAGLLHQYALAMNYYTHDWKYYPDAQTYLQKEVGFVNYLNAGADILPEQITRCPDDKTTEELGRLGDIAQGGISVKVSIGINGNNCSDSLSWRSSGPVAQWLKPEDLKGALPSQVAMWMDYQFQLPLINGEANPLSAPIMKNATNASFIRYAVRHNDAMNVSFHDGHVGSIRLLKNSANGGLDPGPGVAWTTAPNHVLVPFGARPANAGMFPNGFNVSSDVEIY